MRVALVVALVLIGLCWLIEPSSDWVPGYSYGEAKSLGVR